MRGKQEEVQEYILEILNKNPDILMQTKELPGLKVFIYYAIMNNCSKIKFIRCLIYNFLCLTTYELFHSCCKYETL